ncbi:hypothetical protein KCV01_g3042, partial [Aureobasidium melanogenum]
MRHFLNRHPRRHRLVLAGLLITLFASQASLARSLVDRFDRALAQPLPVTVPDTPAPLVIQAPLQATITFSNGQEGRMYKVNWKGLDGVAVRHGNDLRITVNQVDRLSIAHFDPGHDVPKEWTRHIAKARTATPWEPAPAPPSIHRLRSERPRSAGGYTDLHLFAYVENGIQESDDDLISNLFSDWMSQVANEHFSGLKLHLQLRRDVPGVTSRFDATESSLDDWIQRVNAYAPDGEKPRHDASNRLNILLVQGVAVLPYYAGMVDRLEGHYAIASITVDPSVPVHEIGHLLGAEHELATLHDTGDEDCATTMWFDATAYPFCGRFSSENIELMRAVESRLRRFSR